MKKMFNMNHCETLSLMVGIKSTALIFRPNLINYNVWTVNVWLAGESGEQLRGRHCGSIQKLPTKSFHISTKLCGKHYIKARQASSFL